MSFLFVFGFTFLVSLLFLVSLGSLLKSLIYLEFIGFFIMVWFILGLFSSGFITVFFCFLVVEAVLGLVGLVSMVSVVGTDFLSLSILSI